MLGLQDHIIFTVFCLCFLCAVFCVAYGWVNWNKGQENEQDEMKEELLWEETEDKVNKVL